LPGAFFLVEAANLRVRGREGKVAVSGVFADELFVATSLPSGRNAGDGRRSEWIRTRR
jgi:hypothetical protein